MAIFHPPIHIIYEEVELRLHPRARMPEPDSRGGYIVRSPREYRLPPKAGLTYNLGLTAEVPEGFVLNVGNPESNCRAGIKVIPAHYRTGTRDLRITMLCESRPFNKNIM